MKDKTNLTGLNPDNFRSVINGKDTGLYILRNGSGMEMCVTNYGAIVLSIMAPDSHGKFENVVIGFDTLEEARRQSKDYYIGATIGPVAGRILHGAFRVGEKDYHLQLNSVSNTLHSGDNGFHTVVWEAHSYNQPFHLSLRQPMRQNQNLPYPHRQVQKASAAM